MCKIQSVWSSSSFYQQFAFEHNKVFSLVTKGSEKSNSERGRNRESRIIVITYTSNASLSSSSDQHKRQNESVIKQVNPAKLHSTMSLRVIFVFQQHEILIFNFLVSSVSICIFRILSLSKRDGIVHFTSD